MHLLIIPGLAAVGVSCQPVENLHVITDCVCSNDVVIYECTVCRRFATLWEGSAFECPSREITLANTDFGTPRAMGVCNDGRIVARGLSVDSGCYTSQLNVTFDAGLQDRTVICYADNGTHIKEIGRKVLLASMGIHSA